MFTIFTRRFITCLGLGLAVLIGTLSLAAPAEARWHSLTGRLPAHTDMRQLQISPNSRYAVFIADIEVDERYELYSVPVTGTRPLKLNPPLVAGTRVYAVAITPDSQYVIYTAKQEVGNSSSDLYQVPITGGQVAKLNVGPTAGRHVRNFKIDPDNVRIVYEANHQSDAVNELFSVPIAGGMGTKLNPTLVAGGNVSEEFAIDPFGNRVVYLADQEEDNRDELYGVPIAGGMAVKLNPPGSRVYYDFELNPQAPAVVFRAQLDGSNASHLYKIATAGGLLTPLNYPLASNESVVGFHISPNGARVVYNVAVSTPNDPYPINGNLYSVLIGGGDSTLLTTLADPGFGVFRSSFDITADGQRLVYGYRKNAAASPVLESVLMNSGNRATLYEVGADDSLHAILLSPDDQQVVYNTYPSLQTFAIPAAGGAGVPLGITVFPKITPDSSRVIFNHNKPPYDLQSVPISGGEVHNLSRLDDQGEVGESLISPDGKWVVFEVLYNTGQQELRVSDGAEGQSGSSSGPVYLPLIMR